MTRSCVKERTDVMYFHYSQIYEPFSHLKLLLNLNWYVDVLTRMLKRHVVRKAITWTFVLAKVHHSHYRVIHLLSTL